MVIATARVENSEFCIAVGPVNRNVCILKAKDISVFFSIQLTLTLPTASASEVMNLRPNGAVQIY